MMRRAKSEIIELEPRPPFKFMLISEKNTNLIEIMIAPLMEIIELPKFGYVTTCIINVGPLIKICWRHFEQKL